MDNMISSIDFAKYILMNVKLVNKNIDHPIIMNETKLHKLMYISEGILLSNNINIVSENVRAWNYGHVYPKVHKWVSKHNPFDTMNNIELSQDIINYLENIKAKEVVLSVINKMGKYTAGQLSNWSHRPNSPWEKALERNNGVMNGVISKKDMKLYFSRKKTNV